MSFEITCARGRTLDFSGTIFESDESTEVSLAATDVIRFKAGRRNAATPVLEIDSVANGNGSVTTFTAATGDYTLRIAQGDTSSLVPGPYDCELNVVDDSETAPADAIKHVEYGVLHILPSLGGDVGLS